MKWYLGLLINIVTICSLQQKIAAQPKNNYSSTDIYNGILKLNKSAKILYIAAHPDDENTRLLSYLSKERRYKTAYLSLTRGDGGQNLIGKEQGEMLGLIRTQELLAARKVDGAEQYFTRAYDFGYSKNPEETFTFWNKNEVLSDVVLMIRNFEPDIIICRFPTTGEGGHGHHTASAILAQEAFAAAADATIFPEQLAFVKPWKTKSMYWNTFNREDNNTHANELKLDVGVYNALSGTGYGEVASDSRTNHKSQGFGTAKQRGSKIEYFKYLAGDSLLKDFDEVMTNILQTEKELQPLQQKMNTCIPQYVFTAPHQSLENLLAIANELKNIKTTNKSTEKWIALKKIECDQLIIACAGVWAEANTNQYSVVAGDSLKIQAQYILRGNANVRCTKIEICNGFDTTINATMKNNEMYSINKKIQIPNNTNTTNPYWLYTAKKNDLFIIDNAAQRNDAENKNTLFVTFTFNINNTPFIIQRPLVFKETDDVKGEVYRPFEVLPAATINFSENAIVFENKKSKTIYVTVKANTNDVEGLLNLQAKGKWKINIKNPNINLKNKNDEVIIAATIEPNNEEDTEMFATLQSKNTTYNQSIYRVQYDHIPYQFVLKTAKAKLINVVVNKTKTQIGYINGAGDNVAQSLEQIGYQVHILTEDEIANSDLSRYQAIIMGIRAFNKNEKLFLYHTQLMNYVKNGGNYIVQYNTNDLPELAKQKIGPYPFEISRDRVTDEKAIVNFLQANHPALLQPNTITNLDFENWIQERGLYFASKIDSNYVCLFSMNDPKEKPLTTSTITAKYGKGNFVYTGLAFFRELPAGISGAYRLMANLISLPPNDVKP
jgi:LmbE family N-acetylglucosaminyl deacetylase